MNHKELDVWKKSMDLVENVYVLTNSFPSDEKYGLVSQMRRSVVSIPSNIAEGAARKGTKEFIQFLHIALGSLAELETQYLISVRLQYCIQDATVIKNLSDVKRLVLGFRNFLEREGTV